VEQTYAADAAILVVDDERLNRTLMTVALSNAGYTVTCAEHGREALETLQAQPYDVMLLDLLMPEMDGFQVLEQMQTNDDLRHIPVIVTSGIDDMESIIRCIEMGAADFITKPFELALLQARVTSALARRRLLLLEAAHGHAQQRAEVLLAQVIPRGAALTSAANAQQVCDQIVREAVGLGAAAAGRLYLFVEANVLRCEAGSLPAAGLPHLRMQPEGGSAAARPAPAAEVVQRDTPLFLATAEQVAAFDVASWQAGGITELAALLAVPLRSAAGQVLGVLELAYTRPPAPEQAAFLAHSGPQVLGAFGMLAAAALEQHKPADALFASCREINRM
jgi:CheY-like chemotaxis protein